MNILIIGNGGGRERHWVLEKPLNHRWLAKAPRRTGNTRHSTRNQSRKTLLSAPPDIPALLKFAKRKTSPDLSLAPEAPLVIGVVDAFRAEGLKILVSTEAGAQLKVKSALPKTFGTP